MKGLLMKDLAFVKLQAKSMILIFLLVVFMLLQGSNFEFVIVYANIIFTMFVVTTINYDYFENGCAFLMTLPISRKMYVSEKYVLAFLAAGCGLIADVIFMLIAHFLKEEYVFGMDNLIFALAYVLGSLVFVALMLPIELKYGPEKARVAMIVVVAAIFAGVFVFTGIGPFDLSGATTKLLSLKKIVLLGIVGVAVVIALGISHLISCKIMEHKEF